MHDLEGKEGCKGFAVAIKHFFQSFPGRYKTFPSILPWQEGRKRRPLWKKKKMSLVSHVFPGNIVFPTFCSRPYFEAFMAKVEFHINTNFHPTQNPGVYRRHKPIYHIAKQCLSKREHFNSNQSLQHGDKLQVQKIPIITGNNNWEGRIY